MLLCPQQVVNMLLIQLQAVFTQPALQQDFIQRQQLGLGEGRAGHELSRQSLRLPDHAFDCFVVAIAGTPHHRVHIERPDAAGERLMKVEPLGEPFGTLRERSFEALDFGQLRHRRLVFLAPGVEGGEDAFVIPGGFDRDVRASGDGGHGRLSLCYRLPESTEM